MKDIIISILLSIGPGVVLLVIQSVLKGLRPRLNLNSSLFPDLGMDAHVDAVAMLMGVTPLSTQSSPLLGGDLIIVQLFVVFVVTAMFSITGVLHNRNRERLCNVVGLGFFAFGLVWDYLMIFSLTT